ncbi:MAG: LLM class flavin-dependent oxidoreductase, partial [Ilumatobacteraceae bacterium]
GGFLDYADRYVRAGEFIRTARELWDSWAEDEIVADVESGQFLRTGPPGAFEHRGQQFDIRGNFTLPRSPQRYPVVLQAGDSDGGRELAAATSDAIFSRHSRLADGQAFYVDVKARLAKYGRSTDELKIIPATTYVLGDSAEDAAERAHAIRRQQVSPQTAILLLEQLWNRDLSAYDAEGPLPEIDPDVSATSIIQGRARMYADPLKTAADWRQRAEAKGLSIRDLIIDVTGRQSFIGTPTHVADQIDEFVQTDAADGVILVPHITPAGLDDFVDTVVPLLQERGSFRAEYSGAALRENMGLPPIGRYGTVAAGRAAG